MESKLSDSGESWCVVEGNGYRDGVRCDLLPLKKPLKRKGFVSGLPFEGIRSIMVRKCGRMSMRPLVTPSHPLESRGR